MHLFSFFNFKQFQMHLFFFLNFKQSSYYSSIPDCDPEICISQKHNKLHNKCIWESVQKPKWETKSILSIKESYSMKKVSLAVNFPKLVGKFPCFQPVWKERSSILGSKVGLRRKKR